MCICTQGIHWHTFAYICIQERPLAYICIQVAYNLHAVAHMCIHVHALCIHVHPFAYICIQFASNLHTFDLHACMHLYTFACKCMHMYANCMRIVCKLHAHVCKQMHAIVCALHANVCKCMQMYANVRKLPANLPANVCECVQMHANCMRMYTMARDCQTIAKMLTNSSKTTKINLKVSEPSQSGAPHRPSASSLRNAQEPPKITQIKKLRTLQLLNSEI